MAILETIYYGNSVQTWLIALSIIFGAFIVGKVIYWIFGNVVKKITSKTKTKLDDILIDMIEEPIMMAIVLLGMWKGIAYLTLGDITLDWINKAFYGLIVINITWFIARLLDAIFEEYVIPLTEKTESDFDDQIVPIIRKSIKTIIWIIGVIVALDNAGYKIGPILAGLGIGGLALAMAAKDTVANIFGGFTIFTDKPFQLKDRIKIDGFDGTVEEIGLRSTRLRLLSGTQVTIPNSEFASGPVENVTREPARKVILNLGLTYDTTPENIEKSIEILKDIAKKHESVKSNYLVSFNAFGDFSLGILFIYYIKKSGNILDTQTQINLEILKQFNKNKIDMAFPTQTLEIKK